MPFRFDFDEDSACFLAFGEGTVTGAELLGFADDRPDPPAWVSGSLIDFTDCTVAASGDELRTVAAMLSDRPQGGPAVRMALVGGTDTNFGILRQYAVFRVHDGLDIRVFRHRAEAVRWLSERGDRVAPR